MADYIKPLPFPVYEDKEFWIGAKRHELLLKKCTKCGGWIWFTDSICPTCQCMKFEWVRASGRGTIFSYNIAYRTFTQGWTTEDLPYINVIVDLEEGTRMFANLRKCKPEDVKIGMPVELFFDDVTEEVTLPVFKPLGK